MARRCLRGARILLTGASSGIGAALLARLAEAGASVLATARRRERLAQQKERLGPCAANIHLLPGDVTDPQHRLALCRFVQQQWGALDGLINNAGVGALGPFQVASPERLRRVMEVNFFAPVELIRQTLPLLRLGNRPFIVNVASVLGHIAVPGKAEYCASKFALHGFSDALRAELRPLGIDVILVSPSTTRSEFFENVVEKRGPQPLSIGAGMAPETVARKTIHAIRRGADEVIFPASGVLLVWLDRLLPSLTSRLVSRFAGGPPVSTPSPEAQPRE